MKRLQEIRSTPMDKLSISDHFQLEVHKNILDIRLESLKVKMLSGPDRAAMFPKLYYLRGHLHGIIFGMASQLIYQTTDYEECSIIGKAAINEAQFLFDNLND